MKPQKKTCLILQWTSLPPDIKERVKGCSGFHNRCLIPFHLEAFTLVELQKGPSVIQDYYMEEQKRGEFKGDFDEFVKEYGLYFDVWLSQQNFDLEGIDRILVEISW